MSLLQKPPANVLRPQFKVPPEEVRLDEYGRPMIKITQVRGQPVWRTQEEQERVIAGTAGETPGMTRARTGR